MSQNRFYQILKNFLAKQKVAKAGFSLIETVLYLAIVGILLVAVVDFNLTLSGTSSKLGANIKVAQNRRTTLNAIDYLVRNSDGLLKDVNGFCMSSSSLALYFDDDTYLPGTCVESGGGVFISNDSGRVKLSCAPNINYNGWYGACDETPVNSYYLSSPDISVASLGGLVFSTSTATSTFSGFLNLNTFLTFTNISNGQTELLATSTATSTVTLRNQQSDALLGWWKMDDITAAVILDSKSYNDGICSTDPGITTGLVRGSSGAFDFELDKSNACLLDDGDSLNINGSFTITAWVKPESFVAANVLLHKHHYANSLGYATWLESGKFYCRVCDGATCTGPSEANSTLLVGHTYHVACTFDNDAQSLKLYVYEEGVGGLGTTTAATTEQNLVNATTKMRIGQSADTLDNFFDGVLDEVRLYNRKLSDQEIWALQSQGATTN